MPTRSETRWDRRLFAVLWTWLAVRTALPWLVTFRLSLEGDGYSWGSEYFGRMFHSSGLSRPDFLLVYALLAASLLVLVQLRRHRIRLGAHLALAYLGFFAANAAYQLQAGEAMMFHGDTLGIHVDLTVPFFVLQFGMFAVAVVWWWRTRTIEVTPNPRPLKGARRGIAAAALAVLPLQVTLLVIGEPHGTTDAIGVLMTLTQWAVLATVFYPGSDYGSRRSAVASPLHSEGVQEARI